MHSFPKKRHTVLLISCILLMLFGVMSIFPQSGFRTTDDGVLVASYLLSSRENRVLGASSKDMEGSFGCPSDKPVVGWVNFQGRRVIPTNLPAGEEPSACFVDTAEAVAQGFAIEE